VPAPVLVLSKLSLFEIEIAVAREKKYRIENVPVLSDVRVKKLIITGTCALFSIYLFIFGGPPGRGRWVTPALPPTPPP